MPIERAARESVNLANGNRIDVHYHVAPPAWAARLDRLGVMNQAWNDWSIAKAIEDMDRDGVARSIVSVTTPGVWFGDAAEAKTLARNFNDYAAKLRADHPTRFGIFAAVPMPDIDATLAEIAYAFDELHVNGIGFLTSYGDKWLGDIAFAPVMDELNRRRAVVYTHPTVSDCCRNIIPGQHPMLVEYGTDTTRVIGQFVFGAAQRHPDLRLIFSHGGGAMPFLYQRFISNARHPHAPRDALDWLPRFYYDTAAVALAPPMAALRRVVPISQILFGTDYPYGTAGDVARKLRASEVFDAAEIQAIERDNMAALLARVRA